MGNCSLKGMAGDCPNKIRIVKDSGDIIELKGPKLAKDVLTEFSGYGIFREQPENASSSPPPPPMSNYEYLIGGQFYHLLPLKEMPLTLRENGVANDRVCDMGLNEPVPEAKGEMLPSAPALQVLTSQRNGVWKVKLAISSKQLEEIFAGEENTEALIEKMRMAAAAAKSGPRKSKSSWKPCLSNVFKVSPIDGGANKS